MKRNNSKNIITDYTEYGRMGLKNGWDLPTDSEKPVVGRKRENERAYELLIARSDEDYEKSAALGAANREEKKQQKRIQAAELLLEQERKQKSAKSAGEQGASFEEARRNFQKYMEAREEEIAKGEPAKAAKSDPETAPEKLHGLEAMSERDWKRRRTRKIQVILLIVILALGAFDLRLTFGSALLLADISQYEDVAIRVEGLTDEPFTITPKELSKMHMESIKVDVHNGELAEGEVPELGRAVGPSLETFLNEYGASTTDFRTMRVYNENDRSTSYVRTMKEKTMILSIANGHKALGEKEAPLRIAIAGEDTGEWTGWIRKIVFTR